MIQRSLSLVLVAALLVLATLPGLAQGTGQSGPAVGTAPPAKSFLPPQTQRSAPAPEASGPLHGLYVWLTAWQADINRRLANAVRDIRSGNPVTATFILAALSFAYGVLHAAGPGHGKAVISSYVLANERTVRRGIALSFLAALIQGLSALIVVCILVLVLKATGLTMKATEAWLETASWAFVAAVGAWLLWRQLRGLRTRAEAHTHDHHDHGHDHHHHAHSHGHHRHEHSHGDGHHHAHDHACCDHAHIPDPKQLEGAWSWRKALPIALAVGVRPCTGAILVLVFAIGQGLLWAGVFATFAMALGTAITVSALAALAVSSRELAVRIGNGGGGERIRLAAGIGGSALVLLMGIALFIGSLNGPTAF
jgi:nickel/cobalt exporter